MKKHCSWCDNSFDTEINYQIYCSAECREAATKENIAKKSLFSKRQRRAKKARLCKTCGKTLSFYNDDEICMSCSINPKDVKDALKDIKDIINE